MRARRKPGKHQLADVFEHFRQLSLREDGLDPVHYLSTPSLSWDSAFKRCGEEIHLLQEEAMYTFFERGRRGGMTFVNKHYLHRNSPDDDDYDSAAPHTELLYIGKCNQLLFSEKLMVIYTYII